MLEHYVHRYKPSSHRFVQNSFCSLVEHALMHPPKRSNISIRICSHSTRSKSELHLAKHEGKSVGAYERFPAHVPLCGGPEFHEMSKNATAFSDLIQSNAHPSVLENSSCTCIRALVFEISRFINEFCIPKYSSSERCESHSCDIILKT